MSLPNLVSDDTAQQEPRWQGIWNILGEGPQNKLALPDAVMGDLEPFMVYCLPTVEQDI